MKTMESEKRVNLSTVAVILITVAALFAAFAIVIGADVRTAHPFVTAFCAVCALLMLARFARSALCEAGRAQLWRMGVGLTLAVFFTAFALWNGHFPPALTLTLLPAGAVAVTLLLLARMRRDWFSYAVAAAAGVALLALLLGFLGVFAFAFPQPFFAVIYIGMMGFAFGRLAAAKKRTARERLYALPYLAAILLFGGCALFGGYFSPFWSTLIPAAGVLGVTVLLFRDLGWYKKVLPYCIAVPVFAAVVLNAGLMTGFFANVAFARPQPLLLKGYGILTAIALVLAVCKTIEGRAPERIAYFAQLAVLVCLLLFGGNIAMPDGIFALGAATLVCLCSAVLAFEGTRKNRVLWSLVLPVAATVLLLLCERHALLSFSRATPFFIGIYGLTMALALACAVRVTERHRAPWVTPCAVLLCDVCLIAGIGGILLTGDVLILPCIAVLAALTVYFLWKKARYKRVLLCNGVILGFSALAFLAGLTAGLAVRQSPESNMLIAFIIGAVALFISAWSGGVQNRYRSVGGAAAVRSVLCAITCVACTRMVLFGGAIDSDRYLAVCAAVAAVTLVLLIWCGHLLLLNLFTVAALLGLLNVGINVGVLKNAFVRTTGARDLFITSFFVLLIPAVPGALILTLRRCGNIRKCRKALHSFLCAIGVVVSAVLFCFGGRFDGFAKTAVSAVAVGMMIFAVYAVFEKRRVHEF